ncbi:MAG: pyridoxamine 5'-phosphate oxidase [Alpinimonas sp.]|jgi:pyridoxamine 5'-phosphate oxidase
MDSLTRHTDYGAQGLDEADVNKDPMAQFATWLEDAEQAEIFEPNAMVISTVDPSGYPTSRTVLLKGLDSEGFEFVTNYESTKGRALLANPAVALLFPWYSLKRQVMIVGTAVPTDDSTSDAYFARRPQGAQLAAWASDQSEPIARREILDERMAALEQQYPEGSPVPRPEKWGGFRVIPTRIEFWQGRSKRFHDRIRFSSLTPGGWKIERLQP